MKSRLILLLLFPLLAIALVLVLLRYLLAIVQSPAKAWTLAVGVDDLANVAGNGRLGQTISSRAAYAMQAGKPWGCWMCALLDWVNPGHCKKALTATNQNLEQGKI